MRWFFRGLGPAGWRRLARTSLCALPGLVGMALWSYCIQTHIRHHELYFSPRTCYLYKFDAFEAVYYNGSNRTVLFDTLHHARVFAPIHFINAHSQPPPPHISLGSRMFQAHREAPSSVSLAPRCCCSPTIFWLYGVYLSVAQCFLLHILRDSGCMVKRFLSISSILFYFFFFGLWQHY